MRKTGTSQNKARRGRDDGVFAAYGHRPRKAIPFATMLGVLITIGIVVLARTGIRDGWGMALLLIGLPGVLVAAFVRDLLLQGPLLLLTRDGLIDRRRGPAPIPWDTIMEATAKNRIFAKGVRLVLTDGERMEIDLSLLDVEPKDILVQIHAMAGHTPKA